MMDVFDHLTFTDPPGENSQVRKVGLNCLWGKSRLIPKLAKRLDVFVTQILRILEAEIQIHEVTEARAQRVAYGSLRSFAGYFPVDAGARFQLQNCVELRDQRFHVSPFL